MNKIKISIVTIATALLAVACEDPNEGEMFITPTTLESEMSVTTIMERSPETYSLWIEMLRYTDYYNALKDANANATVFCPNNEAVERFLASRELSSIEELDREYARRVVQSHIIDWQDQANALNDSLLIQYATSGEYIPAQNLFNQYLTLSYGYKITDVDDAERTDQVYSTDSIFINNHAKIGRFVSTRGTNGSVYMMDDVIVPNAENIADKLATLDGENNTFSIFAAAIEADPEMNRIARLERDTTISLGGVNVINSYYYTLFATPDHIFNQEGITDVESLKSWLVNHGDEVNPDTALNRYLKYHFMTTRYTMDEVFNFNDPTETLIYDTQFTGQAFIANLVNNQRTINTDIPVLRSDIEASNGYITKIGGIMPVYEPEPVNVRWDFLNSADVISIVNSWGTANFYGNVFSSSLTSTERTFDLSDEYYDGNFGQPTSFTYELTQTSSSTRNYRRIGFIKEAYSSANQNTTPRHGAYMNNYLMLNLGFSGWIEFNTPTIIAGRYRVVLHYIKDPMLATMYTSGTLVQFNMDEQRDDVEATSATPYQALNYLYRGQAVMPLYDTIEETLWNEVVFDGSQTHRFKMTMRDVLARTGSSYHLRLDYVEFIPLD